MPVWLSVTVLVALAAAGLAGMLVGWRHRGARTAAQVPAPPVVPAPDALGAARTEPLEGTYVSSTRAGDWLDRVTAHGLGTRSSATVQVHDAGVLLRRRGAPDVFLPRAALRAVGTSGGMAGKVVGKEGLVVLTWAPSPQDDRGLDTGLRLRHPHDAETLRSAAQDLIRTTPAPAGEEETR
ncbi:MAG TPA: hypothetical protein VGC67_13760 [Cellulomonas sp.]